jgi:hypothetical protein
MRRAAPIRWIVGRDMSHSIAPLPQHHKQDEGSSHIVLWIVLAGLAFWPRAWIIGFWIFSRTLGQAFSSWVIVALGFLVAPWTTLLYAAMWSIDSDGVHGAEWVAVGAAVLVDLFFWLGCLSIRSRS